MWLAIGLLDNHLLFPRHGTDFAPTGSALQDSDGNKRFHETPDATSTRATPDRGQTRLARRDSASGHE